MAAGSAKHDRPYRRDAAGYPIMNYRHAFHAGNFADVVKHIVTVRVIEHMKQKDTPFRFIDTHAGPGLYDLHADAANRTLEWHDGIAKLWAARENLTSPTRALLAPYLDEIARQNPEGTLQHYPGSPVIAQDLLRAADKLLINELHPEDTTELAANLGTDRRVRLSKIDGYAALKAALPPHERRAIVLIDPPYEDANEHYHLTTALTAALTRFATGIYIIWYPIKELKPVDKWRMDTEALSARLAPKPCLSIDLLLRTPRNTRGLNGAGLMILNAPHTLAEEMTIVLDEILPLFSTEPGAEFRLIAGPDASQAR